MQREIYQLLYTILVVLFLFFIDEGYYNFHWMRNAGNWIVFAIYTATIFAGSIIISNVFLKKKNNQLYNLLAVILGSTLSLLIFTAIGKLMTS